MTTQSHADKMKTGKSWHVWALLAVIAAAFLIRSYNFHDWLYFEADQVRNANNAHAVYENGLSELPLLGPKAGGTDLHLGPASYYFEIALGFIFGHNHPAVFAFGNFIFLLLAIPLFFIFLKNFFSAKVSLLTTAVFASSYLLTQSARFSWNPNSLPFWVILFMLGLVKSTDSSSPKRGWWLAATFFSYGVLSQLHFVALMGFGAMAFFFWFFQRPAKINWKYWAGSVGALAAMCLPLVVYDAKNHGQNIRSLVSAFSAKADSHTVLEVVGKFFQMTGKYTTFMLTSLNDKEFGFSILAGCILFVLLGSSLAYLLRKKQQSEQLNKLKHLVGIWTGIFLLIYLKLAYSMDQPRFWLPVLPLLFIALASSFQLLSRLKWGGFVNVALALLLIVLNLSAVFSWYGNLASQNREDLFFRKATATTLKQSDFVIYQNIQKAVAFMALEAEKEEKQPCFTAPATYLASYKYVFDQEHPKANGKRLNNEIRSDQTKKCSIFIIEHRSKEPEDIIDKFEEKGVWLKLGEKQIFGVAEIWPVVEAVDAKMELRN